MRQGVFRRVESDKKGQHALRWAELIDCGGVRGILVGDLFRKIPPLLEEEFCVGFVGLRRRDRHQQSLGNFAGRGADFARFFFLAQQRVDRESIDELVDHVAH